MKCMKHSSLMLEIRLGKPGLISVVFDFHFPKTIRATLYISQTSGKIYVTACSTCHPPNREKSSDDNVESCDTFRLIDTPDDKSYSGRLSFFHPLDRSVVTFGGYAVITNDKVSGGQDSGRIWGPVSTKS